MSQTLVPSCNVSSKLLTSYYSSHVVTPPRAPEPLVNGLPTSLAKCMEQEACAAVAEFQEDWDWDVSGCCEPVHERERLLAYTVNRAVGDRDVWRRAMDRFQGGMDKAWQDGWEAAQCQHTEERGEWKRRRVAHAEELDDVEERLEAEVARNYRLQEALVVATVNSKCL